MIIYQQTTFWTKKAYFLSHKNNPKCLSLPKLKSLFLPCSTTQSDSLSAKTTSSRHRKLCGRTISLTLSIPSLFWNFNSSTLSTLNERTRCGLWMSWYRIKGIWWRILLTCVLRGKNMIMPSTSLISTDWWESHSLITSLSFRVHLSKMTVLGPLSPMCYINATPIILSSYQTLT
jgi:hypothetical protein